MKLRVPEKAVQGHIVSALRTIGARVYILGRPGLRDRRCPKCHQAVRVEHGTRQTAGLADLLAFLPEARYAVPAEYGATWRTQPHQLWVEVKAEGGRRSLEQKLFADDCTMAKQAYLTGGLDVVLEYLKAHGYLRDYAAARQQETR